MTRPSMHSEANMERIKYLQRKGVYDLPNRLRPPCHRDGGHSYKSMYGRLRYDAPAQTITGGFVSPGQGRFVHPSQERALRRMKRRGCSSSRTSSTSRPPRPERVWLR
jgi:DNA (cytosine-5)-methyltransferase 1